MTEIYEYAPSKEKFEYRPVGCRTGLQWWPAPTRHKATPGTSRMLEDNVLRWRKISMMPYTSNNEPRITSTFKFAIAPTLS
jgi:hypothetical protein